MCDSSHLREFPPLGGRESVFLCTLMHSLGFGIRLLISVCTGSIRSFISRQTDERQFVMQPSFLTKNILEYRVAPG